MNRKIIEKPSPFLMTLLVLLCFFAVFDTASSESAVNEGFIRGISGLMADNVIPKRKGTIISLGDFEDFATTYGYYQWTPLLETQHFVFYTKLSWASTAKNTDALKAGCGIVFHLSPATNNSVVMSLRMDGNIYFDGVKNYKPFSLGYYYFHLPSFEDTFELMVVVDGENAIVYVDGNRIVTKANLPVQGSYFGLCSISGSYQEQYGTMCSFKDMVIYTW